MNITTITNEISQQLKTLAIKKILLAYSGGLDSTVLVALFAQLKTQYPDLQIRAIHINHGLSSNAESWGLHCQTICQQLHMPLIIRQVVVSTEQGLEAGARQARYQQIAQQIDVDEVLVTAHHLNDQVESFLLALKRGSGPKGLASMSAFTTLYGIKLWRPLLAYDRTSLEQIATDLSLTWVEDESNQDIGYDRNFIRYQVLPVFNQRWPSFLHNVARSATYCAQQEDLLTELLADTFNALLDEQANLKISDFQNFSHNKQKQLLRMWLASHQLLMPTSIQLDELIKQVIMAPIDRQPQLKLDNKIIRRYQQKLYITEILQDVSTFSQQLMIGAQVNLPDNLGLLIVNKDSDNLIIDWQVNQQQQHYRLPKPAANSQIFVRFHYTGKVKLHAKQPHKILKHIFQDAKIPVWQRQRIPYIFYDQQLVAVLGVFVLDKEFLL